MLALWLTTPPPKIHTPASLAARTTACAASPTAGSSCSGITIAPSSNEIRYRVNPLLRRSCGFLLWPFLLPAFVTDKRRLSNRQADELRKPAHFIGNGSNSPTGEVKRCPVLRCSWGGSRHQVC